MAVRANDTLLAEVIPLDPEITTVGAIKAANRIVNRVCLESDYEEDHLIEIETWLAAHFYSVIDKQTRPQSESAAQGQAAVTYFGKVGLYFEVTFWGQQAIMLDTEGNLRALQTAAKNGGVSKGQLTFVGNMAEDYSWLGELLP